MSGVLFTVATILLFVAVAIFASVAWLSIRAARDAHHHFLER